MKRCGLLLTTLSAVVLTGWVLHRPDGLSGQGRTAPLAGHHDAAVTSAAWHYFQTGPRHWRNCLLNP
jgi:hypothetical protein